MAESMEWARRGLDYEPPDVDTTVPHPARIYNYVLGGRDNYASDRAAAERMLMEWPALRTAMRQNRRFMYRAVGYLAAERGIDQFLDIGTGIPAPPDLHEIAQDIHPTARVVYVDNDPIVFVHAQARLTSSPQGRVACIQADMREPDTILDAPELHATLDFDRPIAVTILGVIYTVTDNQQAYDLVQQYLRPLPSGSTLALSTVTTDHKPPSAVKVLAEYNARGIPMRAHTKAEVERYFDGLDLVEPGVVLVHRWRPDAESTGVLDIDNGMYGGVAVKP
jgi:hypothetical protein